MRTWTHGFFWVTPTPDKKAVNAVVKTRVLKPGDKILLAKEMVAPKTKLMERRGCPREEGRRRSFGSSAKR